MSNSDFTSPDPGKLRFGTQSIEQALEPPNACQLLPTFRYNMRPIPVEVLPVMGLGASVIVTLHLRGQVTLTPPHPAPGVSIDNNGLRVEANAKMGEFISGLRVSGLGSDRLSIGGTIFGPYLSAEARWSVFNPNTVAYLCWPRPIELLRVDGWKLTGMLGFDLTFTVIPNPPRFAGERTRVRFDPTGRSGPWGALQPEPLMWLAVGALAVGLAVGCVLAPEVCLPALGTGGQMLEGMAR